MMLRLKPIPVVYWISIFILFFGIELVAVYAANLNTLSVLLQHHWQIADMFSLAAEPFTSWIYIHSQPPLLNLIIATFLTINGEAYTDFIILNCLCAAFTSSTILFIINKCLVDKKWLGYVFAVVYLLAPATLLNSAYPYYPALTSAGYAGLALSFFTAHRREKLSLTILCVSLIFLTLLRSSFPPVIAILVICVYFLFVANATKWKRQFLFITIVSLLPIATIYAKNFLMYDFWGSTSFAPINLAKGFGAPVELNYFPSPQQIKQERPNILCEHGYKSIDTDIFKKDGNPNYNSCIFLAFANTQRHMAWDGYDLNQHMRRILAHIGKYFSLPDKYEYLSNRINIQTYSKNFNSVFLPLSIRDGYDIRLTILLLIVIMPLGLWTRPDKRMISLYTIFLIHLVTHVLTDGDESDRFVFDIEFCFYIFFVFLISLYFGKKELNI